MERVEISMVSGGDNHDHIRKAIAAGYFYHTARLQKDGSYRTIKNPQQVWRQRRKACRWGASRS
jgi:pre-mRNA-splicing factor ATP-dependent RNA helicase DHX16